MDNLAKYMMICCLWFICVHAVQADGPNDRSSPNDLAIERKAFQQLIFGDAYATAGDFDQAVRCFQNAVALSPDRADFHFKLACAAWNVRNVELASEHFLKATQLDDHFAEAYLGCKSSDNPQPSILTNQGYVIRHWWAIADLQTRNSNCR